MENVYYEQLEHSTYDSLCTKPDFCESEGDVSDYDSPSPLDYEIPDQSTEAVPEIPKREPAGPSSYPPHTLPRKDCNAALVQEDSSLHAVETENQKLNLGKLYTALTHTHVPSVYCTPSHSMEFRSNAARVSNSTLDIVNLESSGTTASPPPTPLHKDKLSLALHRPYRHYSRAKVAVSVFLVTAIAVAMIALGVSIVAVFVVAEGGPRSETTISESEAFMRDNITILQAEIGNLQREVEQARNETRGTLELSSLYQNCQQETKSESCSSSTSVGPVCLTDPLPLEKQVSMVNQ